MVVPSRELLSSELLLPVQMHDGTPVTILRAHQLFRGVLRIIDQEESGFEVHPQLDLNQNPIGDMQKVAWPAIIGKDAEVKVFERTG